MTTPSINVMSKQVTVVFAHAPVPTQVFCIVIMRVMVMIFFLHFDKNPTYVGTGYIVMKIIYIFIGGGGL